MDVALLIDPSLPEVGSLATLASELLMKLLGVNLSAVVFFAESGPKFLMSTSNLQEFIGKLSKFLYKSSASLKDWNPTKQQLVDSWSRRKKQEILVFRHIHLKDRNSDGSDFWDKGSLIEYFKRVWMVKIVRVFSTETKFLIVSSSSNVHDNIKIVSKEAKYPLFCFQSSPIRSFESELEANFIWELEGGYFIDKENLYEPIPEDWQDHAIPNYYPNKFDIIDIFIQNFFGNKARPIEYRHYANKFIFDDFTRFKPVILESPDPFIREFVGALLSDDKALIKSFTDMYISYQNNLSDVLFPECTKDQRFEMYYMMSIELLMLGIKVPLIPLQRNTINPNMDRPYLKPILPSENTQLVSTRAGKIIYQIKSLYSPFFGNFH